MSDHRVHGASYTQQNGKRIGKRIGARPRTQGGAVSLKTS